jgi:ubiquinone/menaquinone biosynthesis C-methylase UbiE
MTFMHKEALEEKILGREWFYEFRLPGGKMTKCYLPDEVKSIHRTREKVILDYLGRRVGSRWKELRCLDIACHEGFFALMLAKKGCREVVGVDARPEHVESANLMRDLYGLKNVTFQQGDLFELNTAELGKFDIVLLFGVLYHVPDIMGALRIARVLTKELCVIETQIAPEMAAELEWGTKDNFKRIEGCLAIVDESGELLSGNMEAAITSVSLVPSRKALLFLLRQIGFSTVEILPAFPFVYEQLTRGRRLMIAANTRTV